MKRLICLFLAFNLLFLCLPFATANDSNEAFYTVKVEYSDNRGQLEDLNLMVKDDQVYVDAKMIANRLGYMYEEGNNTIIIYNPETTDNLPRSFTVFNLKSTQVSHLIMNTVIESYRAPFESEKNNSGTWIPFEYSLYMMNSGYMLLNDTILIDIPTKNITDLFYDIAKQMQRFQFDYADDFGYSGLDEKVLAGSSHLINVFNGILAMDGDSWLALFQQFLGSTEAYDKKYAEDIALLLCTESDKELEATIESIDKIVDLFSEDGDLGVILSRIDKSIDRDIGTLYGQCEQLLQHIKDANVPSVTYNRTYQALETALNKQTWFSETGGAVLQVQKDISADVPFTLLNFISVILEVEEYDKEFQNQDNFSVGAVSRYLGIDDSDYELLLTMKDEMREYCTSISGNLAGYMDKRLQENIVELVTKLLPTEKALGKIIGAQASSLLLAWDLATAVFPFVKDGLSSADNFELSLYAQIIQNGAFLTYVNERSKAFSSESSINAENLYTVAQLCYTYLKACYITREAALASLKVKPDAILKKIQPLVDYQNKINEEIAQMLVALKSANKENENYIYGFLPNDNTYFLSVFDDGKLVSWVTSSSQPRPSVEDDAPTGTNVDEETEPTRTDYSPYTGSCGANLTWRFDPETATLTIEGSGAMEDYKDTDDVPWYHYRSKITTVSFPDGMTCIGDRAFMYCRSLTSVTIPDSVASIGSSAFEDCVSLTSVTIPASVTSIDARPFPGCSTMTVINVATDNTRYISLDGVLFNKSRTELIQYPAGKADATYTIPDSVTSIGDSAFEGCSFLKSVTIPDGVTSIGKCVFFWCTSLTSVTIPTSVTSIGNQAFYNCDSLKSVKIPDSVTSFGSGMFADCDSLMSVTIPDGVTSIGPGTFAGCLSLTSVTIPDSVTSIGSGAFSGCFSLTSMTIPDSVTSISNDAFHHCESLTSVTIPDSVASIGSEAFEGCSSLTSVTIPASVTKIGDKAFGYWVDKNLVLNCVEGFTIHGYPGTAAQDYADENGFHFVNTEE